MQLTSRVLKLLGKKTYLPSTAEEIYKQLKEPNLSLKQLKKTLIILEAEEKIQLANQKYFATSKEKNIINGRFQANAKGFGFVLHSVSDIYIRSDKTGNALNGDIVEARITRRKGRKKLEGKIVNILERAFTSIIGRVEVRAEKKWLIPSDRRVQKMFLIKDGLEVKDGQMIVAAITKYPPQGTVSVTEVLGDENSAEVEAEVIIREHNLPISWPDDVLKQAAKLPSRVEMKDLEGRKDYRNEYVVTIDGLDAKDFDDAVCVKKKGDKYHLSVHIADVSAYVAEKSPLDEEAKKRGNSTYLPDRVIPMFPLKLSNGIASLNPNVDRLTLSVESIINRQGEVESFEINKGIIKSKARLTYKEVDTALKTKRFKDEQQKKILILLFELYQILEKNRLKKGSLFFETIEPKIILNNNLIPIDIRVRERTMATAIIEETMIITNNIVAKYMSKRRYPIIYRSHEEPSENALLELEGLLKSLNYPVKEIKEPSHETYQKIIKFAHKQPDKLLLNSVLIRSMQKAKYSANKKSHFGLSLKYYCHFTSPIRRYADLLVHRQIKRMLEGDFAFDKGELIGQLHELAESISLIEVESQAAERESVDLMIARFMKNKVGEIYEGVITGITSFGFFVQIANSAEGLVHITNLRDDYYVYDAEKFLLRGRRTNRVFRLGQKLKVRLTKVIIGERQLDFEVFEEQNKKNKKF